MKTTFASKETRITVNNNRLNAVLAAFVEHVEAVTTTGFFQPFSLENDWACRFGCTVAGVNLLFWVRHDDRTDRFEVSVDLPQDIKGRARSSGQLLAISEKSTACLELSCDANKAPKLIAGDIARKLFPTATLLTNRCLQQDEAARNHQAARETSTARLAAILGTKPTADQSRETFQFDLPEGAAQYGNITVQSDGCVCIDIRYASLENAAKVAEFLKTL